MSTIAEYRKLKKEIGGGKLRPVYLLHGEEGFFIDKLAEEIAAVALAEHERDFNLTILYGKDSNPDQVKDAALRFPMMAERQVVMVRELQTWRTDAMDKLEAYLKKPSPTTVLVLCHKHKKVDGRRTVIKTIQKSGGNVFNSDRMRDHELPDWIEQLARHYKRRIGEVEAALLAGHLGSDLARVVGEVEKLCLVTEEGATITSDLIQRMVGISKDYNIFELQKALGSRDALKAQRIAQYYAQSPRDHPFVLTVGMLNTWFAKVALAHQYAGKGQSQLASALKVNPYFVHEYTGAARMYPLSKVTEIQHMLATYDMRSKGLGGSAPEGDLLRELLARIMA